MKKVHVIKSKEGKANIHNICNDKKKNLNSILLVMLQNLGRNCLNNSD